MNCGNSCAEIFRMFEGYYGPYYTPAVDEDGTLSWTNNAGLPNPPAISIKGDPGTGLEISGLVATEADLPATAEDWTCYLVGTEIPYTVYTYNPNNGLDLARPACIRPEGRSRRERRDLHAQRERGWHY